MKDVVYTQLKTMVVLIMEVWVYMFVLSNRDDSFADTFFLNTRAEHTNTPAEHLNTSAEHIYAREEHPFLFFFIGVEGECAIR